MHLEQHVDDLTSTLEAGRRRLARVDLSHALESARAGAWAAAPERWRKPEPRSRWPIVGLILVVGAVGAMVLCLRPTLERAIDGRSDRAAGPGPDQAVAHPPRTGAYPTTPWDRTGKETINGDQTGF